MIQRRLNKIKLLGSNPTSSVPASSDDSDSGGDSGDDNGDGDSDIDVGTSDGVSGSSAVSSSHHNIRSSDSGNNVDSVAKQG